MMTSIDRRLRKLELVGGRAHPWHVPFKYWSERQIAALIAPGRPSVTDAEFERFIGTAPDHVLEFIAGDGDPEASILKVITTSIDERQD